MALSPLTLTAVGPAPLPQEVIQHIPAASPSWAANSLKLPGESPAYHCSDPTYDIFQIRRFDSTPTNARILVLNDIHSKMSASLTFNPLCSGYYLTTRFIGTFNSSTGDFPWLNIIGTINGRRELEPLYNAPLCDIDVFQKIAVPRPGDNGGAENGVGKQLHRACPPSIQKGYAVVSSPPMPLTPQTVPEGKYKLRAEATTQDGTRIFCIEGGFDVTT